MALPPVRGEVLPLDVVVKKWGSSEFNPDKFKLATIEERAQMAASILRGKNKFVGLPRGEIRKSLGDYSGFYVSGMYPTYLIQDARTSSDEAWQLVFLIDVDGKIRDVVVHKNCCYP
jgi:hypothetical protein